MAPNNPLGISRQNILSLALRSLDLAVAPIRNRTTGVFVCVAHLHQFPRLKTYQGEEAPSTKNLACYAYYYYYYY